ncbi:hypothetical protein [Pedobacter sp. N23S346]|uniref:hypothetical protein n=1 Tax=Pedobacter sp. N23S346 TaxID=3402750 RepID=UPI003ACE0AE0
MSDVRFGEIICINRNEKYGIIMDDNFQDIPFISIDLPEGIKVNDQVSFEIELGVDGLIATKISLI